MSHNQENNLKIAIIGGGAAGFFAAISAKESHPNASVVIFEKSQKVLSKVKISGGGRCNLTHHCTTVSELCKAYPRGGSSLKKAFQIFNHTHTMQWFTLRGVALTTQEDNCVFPASQSSQSIIDCFLKEARKLNIAIELGHHVSAIQLTDNQLELIFQNNAQPSVKVDKLIVTTGGSPLAKGLDWLKALHHDIVNPVPSLFSFNIPNDAVTQLMGVVIDNALVSVQGCSHKATGPLLITHWGMSGPAILKLSSYAARDLQVLNYNFNIQVNWVGEPTYDNVLNTLMEIVNNHPQKIISNQRPFGLPERLWLFLLEKCEIPPQKKWSETGKKGLNKLTNILTNDIYSVKGKSTYKTEFVTCGGVSLQSLDMQTMQSKSCPNIYFAGEVLDIDAITGGFNLQAAWSTGYIAGKLL